MSRFQVPSPPRKARDPLSMEEPSNRRPADREPTRVSSIDRDYPQKRTPHHSSKRHSVEREETHGGRSSADDRARPRKNSIDKEEHSHRRSSLDMEIHPRRERNADRERHSHKRRWEEREEHSHKHHRHGSRSHRREGQHGPTGRDRSSDTLL